MEKTEKLHRAMTRGRIGPLILKLAIPNTVGLLVISAYSLADSYFVSELGTEASAAVGVTFSLHVLIQAVGYTLGMGAGSLLSRSMGKQKIAEASQYALAAILLSLLCGGAISASGLAFRDPLLRLLGATEAVYPLASAYITPLLWSAPAMCASFVFSQLLRAEGRAVYSMLGLAVGSGLNIALDPLFINVLDFGIAGAAIATLISQCVSALFLVCAYPLHHSHLQPFEKIRLSALLDTGKILVAGLPSLFRQGFSGVAAILLNRAAASSGDAAVAAMSLVSRIFILVFSLCLGIAQGMMPVAGYNHGAGNHERIRRAYLFSMIASTAVMLLISIPLFLFSPQILAWFRDDPKLIEIGAFALRAQSVVLFTHGTVTSTILLLQAIGHPYLGTLLAAARQGIFFLPLIFLLPVQWELTGVELTQPTADALTLLFAIPFVLFSFFKIRDTQKLPDRN
ncbi:MAG: MATE family efflux transporter [Clostridia bacterium]|nr:MATE family efflux transporter [Clostridia bacterium]